MLMRLPQRKLLSSTQLIELHAHIVLPVRALKFKYYIPSTTAAALMGMPHGEFIYLLMNSNTLHGLRTKEGYVVVHPDGLNREARKKGYKSVIAIAKRISRKYPQVRECPR